MNISRNEIRLGAKLNGIKLVGNKNKKKKKNLFISITILAVWLLVFRMFIFVGSLSLSFVQAYTPTGNGSMVRGSRQTHSSGTLF